MKNRDAMEYLALAVLFNNHEGCVKLQKKIKFKRVSSSILLNKENKPVGIVVRFEFKSKASISYRFSLDEIVSKTYYGYVYKESIKSDLK